jgi:signal transduction histidine kinase/ligand-binding sensor domain-containing protein/DNA-binding response OmpR family regulator
MKTSSYLLLILCFLNLFSLGINPPDHFDFSFRRISPLGGFTYGAINSIAEDVNGFIWFGTVRGLYRYNTVEVQKFVNDPKDSTTIPNNSIRSIFCDSSGTLWIGTTNGLCVYDNKHDKFVSINFKDNSGDLLGNNIREIFQGEGQNIYFLSNSMLGKLNKATNQFVKIALNQSPRENFVSAVSDLKGKIYIGGTHGTIWLYDSENKQSRIFCNHRAEQIRKIFLDDSTLWIAYDWSGLDHLGFKGDLIAHYGSNPDDKNKINHNRVRDIYKDESDRIWIATYKGISLIDHGKIINMLPKEISGLPYNSVYKIFRDSKNGIWMGTWSGGLAYRSNFDNRFIHFRKEQSDSELDDEFVSSFAEKTDGTVLIGTEFGNLNRLDRESGKMINIPLKTENEKKIENIKSLLFDKKAETLWVGTFLDGLWSQQKNETFLRRLNKFDNSRTSIYVLTQSDSGIWIGSYGKGLYHYNTISGEMKNFITNANDTNSISNNQIRAILTDKNGSLWIGTRNGLNNLNPKTGQFKRYDYQPNAKNCISNDEILSLFQDNAGNVWIGTSGGINKYNQKTNLFETFRIKNGLIGDDIYGIQEDKNGKIWISTENGISSIHPEQSNFRNYYREDELKGNQYNPGAVFLTSKGEILFGNTKGFTLFAPEQMKTNPFAPNAIITSLSINNLPVDVHTAGSPLKNTIQTESVVKLSYHQNSLTFNFVANNFLLPNKNQFKYRLVNYDNHWIDAGNQNDATYTKIPAGNYVFEVVACNNDNLWNEKPAQLKIIISPPLWFSWYAYLIYFIISSLIVYFIRKEVLERQRYKKQLLLERLVHDSEAEVHKMKLRFFTNISHEFRTPLTLISSPLNMLLAKFNFEPIVREHLLTIQRNSNRLLRLINQLIDIARLEFGKSVFHPRNADLIALCFDVIDCFEMEAKDKNIQLSFNSVVEKINIKIDPEKVDKILFNILSNAMKFTPKGGKIGIVVYTTHSTEPYDESFVIGEAINGEIICIEFSDSGPGIASDDLLLIFERFGQGENHQSSGTGIGLHMAIEFTRMHKGNIRVKSRIGSGSVFTICLPLTEGTDRVKEEAELPNPNIQLNMPEVTKEKSDVHSVKDKVITVLIIEDNYELRIYLKNLLSMDYRVVNSPNGKQGLETALTIIPDLVITDVMMPQMDGFEVCRLLKEDIRTSHIPVILLTALNEAEKQIGGLKTGADAYLTKPFDENILLAQVENLLRSRAKLREIFAVSDTDWANGMELLSSDRMLIDKATLIVEQHLTDKSFVVEHLASHLGISASSMYRKLKVLTNQSPTEFVRYIRLKKTISLMDEGHTNLEDIGYATGFNSPSYFTYCFRKQFGKTPTDYLNDLKSKNS